MSAYLIVQATVTDWPKFQAYIDVVPALVEKFGGTYIVMGGDPELIEGERISQSIVMSQWPSKAAAKLFWQSQEYQAAISLRAGTGEFHVMLVDGLSTEQL